MESRSGPRVYPAQHTLRPTRAEVDLSAVVRNLTTLQALAKKPVLAVVKANAYGHGLTRVATRLDQEGVFGFGVALAEEGFALRRAGIRSTILVLSGVYGGAYTQAIEAQLTPVIHDIETLRAFSKAAREPLRVHVKIDTGMRRLGFRDDQVQSLISALSACPNITVDGLFTHLAAVDLDPEFTDTQLGRFEKARRLLATAGHKPTLTHASNSFGSALRSNAAFDLVRPGVALYGVWPSITSGPELSPAMRIRTEIIALREVVAGETVGYDRTYKASSDRVVATIPVGYGDGYPWRASGVGEVLLRGNRCPLVGRVAMDLCTIDVTDVPAVSLGDEVVLLGRQASEEIRVEELAERTGELPYAILTGVSPRVPRVYFG